jgi:hypothetical protein
MALSKLKFILRALLGVWLGLWTIAGVATFAGGLFIFALQLYGYFGLGFWARLTTAGILRGFNIPYPRLPWELAQRGIDCVLLLPLAGLFIWCGFHMAVMAWIARKNLEEKSPEQPELIPATDPRLAAFGVSALQVRRKR